MEAEQKCLRCLEFRCETMGSEAGWEGLYQKQPVTAVRDTRCQNEDFLDTVSSNKLYALHNFPNTFFSIQNGSYGNKSYFKLDDIHIFNKNVYNVSQVSFH